MSEDDKKLGFGFFLKDKEKINYNSKELDNLTIMCSHIQSNGVDSIAIDNNYKIGICNQGINNIFYNTNKLIDKYEFQTILANLSYFLDLPLTLLDFSDSCDEIKNIMQLNGRLDLSASCNNKKKLCKNIQESMDTMHKNIHDELLGLTIHNHYRSFIKKDGSGYSIGLKTHYNISDETTKDSIERALICYDQGLNSFRGTDQILNYWRVLEAVTSEDYRKTSTIKSLIEEIENFKLEPIWSTKDLFKSKYVDLNIGYKKFTLNMLEKYFDKNKPKILDYFWSQRRVKIVHSKKDVLIPNKKQLLYSEALVLKYLARCKIQEKWTKALK